MLCDGRIGGSGPRDCSGDCSESQGRRFSPWPRECGNPRIVLRFFISVAKVEHGRARRSVINALVIGTEQTIAYEVRYTKVTGFVMKVMGKMKPLHPAQVTRFKSERKVLDAVTEFIVAGARHRSS